MIIHGERIMEGEVHNFFKVWLLAFISFTYSYYAIRLVPKSATLTRFLIIFPIIPLFLHLPFKLHSAILGPPTCFFIAWLANFKLLLLAFNKGQLSHPHISLPQFIALASLPIRLQTAKQTPNSHGLAKAFDYAIKILLIATFFKIYNYTDQLHPVILNSSFILLMYFFLEIILALFALLAKMFLDMELEPQFNHPYLATSLQDFWGRRWNLMVTRMLYSTVYEPTRGVSGSVLGRKWAAVPAVMATFTVSGIMHELIVFYYCRTRPSWEMLCFFMMHGVCLMVEIGVKKWVKGRWRVPRVVSGPLAVGFVLVTAYWLFLPPLLRCHVHVRVVQEYKVFGNFVKDVRLALASKYIKT